MNPDKFDVSPGIVNENEFYSHHFLAHVFQSRIQDWLKALTEQRPDATPPAKTLARLAAPFFQHHARYPKKISSHPSRAVFRSRSRASGGVLNRLRRRRQGQTIDHGAAAQGQADQSQNPRVGDLLAHTGDQAVVLDSVEELRQIQVHNLGLAAGHDLARRLNRLVLIASGAKAVAVLGEGRIAS